MRSFLVPLVALLAACASAPPPPAAEPPPAAAPAQPAAAAPAVEMAPAPFTSTQLRDASPTGRKIVFKVEEPDKPAVKRTIEFVKSDAAGADTRSTTVDASGKVLESSDNHATWDELRSHGEFPKGSVEVYHRTVSVPLGTLECTVYKVTGQGPDPEVTTFYFADKLPGPPVFFYVEKGGKRIRTSTMESSSGLK